MVNDHAGGSDSGQLGLVELGRLDISPHFPEEEFRTLHFVFDP
jgi:hypothetical protein